MFFFTFWKIKKDLLLDFLRFYFSLQIFLQMSFFAEKEDTVPDPEGLYLYMLCAAGIVFAAGSHAHNR